MIYFDENFKKLIIPVDFSKKIVKITLSNYPEYYEFTNFTVNYDKKHYITVTFDEKVEIVNGQYEYRLFDEDDNEIEKGILQYGDFKVSNNEYNIENENITVYE